LQKSRPRKRERLLNEEQSIATIWKTLADNNRVAPQGKDLDPFSDDVAWFKNKAGRIVVCKSDVLVSSTDAPSQMSADQIGSKAIVACVSDFAAKGVIPKFALLSIVVPRANSTRRYISGLSRGFKRASEKYGLKVLGGDTGESNSETIVNCSAFGFAEKITKRSGAKPGDMIATTGCFGLQAAGLELLLNRRRKVPRNLHALAERAKQKVLEPEAKLQEGLKISRYTSSAIDSSDGLAISLYYLAEASGVDLLLDKIPLAQGTEDLAKCIGRDPQDLALYGGEEYEIVFTFPSRYLSAVRTVRGAEVIGSVLRKNRSGPQKVFFDTDLLARRGYLHNSTGSRNLSHH
jgi:thiamine-monophosphate kinase